jgi:hypothetical protein
VTPILPILFLFRFFLRYNGPDSDHLPRVPDRVRDVSYGNIHPNLSDVMSYFSLAKPAFVKRRCCQGAARTPPVKLEDSIFFLLVHFPAEPLTVRTMSDDRREASMALTEPAGATAATAARGPDGASASGQALRLSLAEARIREYARLRREAERARREEEQDARLEALEAESRRDVARDAARARTAAALDLPLVNPPSHRTLSMPNLTKAHERSLTSTASARGSTPTAGS